MLKLCKPRLLSLNLLIRRESFAYFTRCYTLSTIPPKMAAEDVSQLAKETANLKLEGKTKVQKGKKGDSNALDSVAVPLELSPPPEYLQYRLGIWDQLKKEYDASIAKKPRSPINITLPDGAVKEAVSWETTPLDIARGISKSLSERIVSCKVNGTIWDLTRPFEEDASLQLLNFDDAEGKCVFWHSSAHVLGQAAERHFGSNLCIGPDIEEGFFYEMGMDRAVSQADYAPLDTLAAQILKENQPFERLVITKDNLLKMFKHNKYKTTLIQSKVQDGSSTTAYRCGSLIDMCHGPHLPSTGRIKAFSITKNSSSYFLGNAENDSLQRIYGVSFPETKMMKEYKKFVEEAAKRDHRRLGVDQELFFFHQLSPGSCFFLPMGTRIYNTLVDLQRAEYKRRGFDEVVTPNMFNTKLWETSGHWQNYQENMFAFDVEKESFALKPMNCPGHCLMFANRERSYRELPIRMADFGVLHRNEFSGALTGLTRVRRFQQDDAHIFCMLDQLHSEMNGCLDFLRHIYGIFGFEFSLKLSTRPEKYLGKIETWQMAEKMLENALNEFGHPWEVNPGDGAFYGPKIDITISDALRRKHQCATIQLDFQLPERFNLEYKTDNPESPYARPVIIHRAILGSVERMIAILIEHYAGKWPLWLSPRQIMIVPIAAAYKDYAAKLQTDFHSEGFYVETDLSDMTLNKKIRTAQLAQWNFIFVVGEEEQKTGTVNVRARDDDASKQRGQTLPVSEVLQKLLTLKREKSPLSKL